MLEYHHYIKKHIMKIACVVRRVSHMIRRSEWGDERTGDSGRSAFTQPVVVAVVTDLTVAYSAVALKCIAPLPPPPLFFSSPP